MKAVTRLFGEIEIPDEKVIHFENGIVGFPELQDFALIHDNEKADGGAIRWLQSFQEPAFALPVMDPLTLVSEYNPSVEDELLAPIGGIDNEELLVLVTVTIPRDITQISLNLRAPIIINSQDGRACQIITDEEKYPVKYMIYDLLQAKKAGE